MKEKEFEEPLAQSSVSLKLELIQQRCSQLMDDPDALELTLDEPVEQPDPGDLYNR